MNYTKTFLFVFSFTITLIFFSCEKGTEPEQLKPGRRDYTWTVDTLNIFATYLSKMWGSSPTDVWAVGHGGSLDDDIWHYDGIEWEKSTYTTAGPWCIHGFAKDDVWVGGEDGEIWHYDGTTWTENLRYQNSDYTDITFMDIWGEKPYDIYAVGFADSSNIRFGLMMHYNGTEWSRLNIEFIDEVFMKIRKGANDNNFFVWNYFRKTGSDSTKYHIFDGKNLKTIYCDVLASQTLTIIDDEVLFNFNGGVYNYAINKFNLIAKNPLPNVWNTTFGRDSKDIIWAMSDGLTHYNGTDFVYILNFEKKSLSDGVIFENEIFFVANDFYNDSGNNLIYHGVLK